MKLNQLYNLDCRIGLKQMIQEGLKVDCVITSPPYWSLRDYGIEPSIWDGDSNCEHDFINNIRKVEGYNNKKGFWQNDEISRKNSPESWKELEIKDAFCSKCGAWKGTLGLEPDFNLFLKHLCDVYDLIWQVLKPSGTNWVNLGDSYGSGKCYDGKYNQGPIENKPPVKGYQKCLLMLPQRFAIEMINHGWILRNVIIWHKPNCMPSSARDRFTIDFDHVYFFVKSNKTQYWINEKNYNLISKKPLGKKGIENIDWEWRECPKCEGTGIKHKECSFCDESSGWYYDKFLRPRICPKCMGKGKIRKSGVCERCKGNKVIKYNFWSGKQYYFDPQREQLSSNPATQERYQYKVGNQSNRKEDPGGMTKPGKIFSQYFPQNLEKIRGYKNKSNLEVNPQHHGQNIPTYKGGRNKRCVWTIPTKANPEAHFATFPPKLVKPMIKAGCPKFICSQCGKPRERIFKNKKKYEQIKEKWHHINMGGSIQTGKNRKTGYPGHISKEQKFKGYSNCDCGEKFVPGIVLDPFAGIGTTLYQAWKLGRNFIGFEISKEYCEIAEKKYLSKTRFARLEQFIK